MGSAIPKQFLELAGKPMLVHTLERFVRALPDIRFVVALPSTHLEAGRALLRTFQDVGIVAGGDTRYASVKNALAHVPLNTIVLVHDAVRCLLSPALVQSAVAAASITGAAIPVIALKDSIRRIVPDEGIALDQGRQSQQAREHREQTDPVQKRDHATISENREQFVLVQTPQAFRSDILHRAYESPYRSDFTDDASVVESAGIPVHTFPGEDSNIKITTPQDLLLASVILSR